MYSPTFIELLAGYARYHQDRRNKVLHAIGIPLLMTSYLYGLSTPIFRVEIELAGFPLSLGVVLFALCGTYWTVLFVTTRSGVVGFIQWLFFRVVTKSRIRRVMMDSVVCHFQEISPQ